MLPLFNKVTQYASVELKLDCVTTSSPSVIRKKDKTNETNETKQTKRNKRNETNETKNKDWTNYKRVSSNKRDRWL